MDSIATGRNEEVSIYVIASVLFFICLICGCILYSAYYVSGKDFSDHPDFKRLISDPEIMNYVDSNDLWNEGIISYHELNFIKRYSKSLELKRKFK